MLAAGCTLFSVVAAGRGAALRLFPRQASWPDRWMAAATLAAALGVVCARVLLAAGCFRLLPLLAVMAALAVAAHLPFRLPPRPRAAPGSLRPLAPALPAILVGLAALGLAAAAARYLPIWAWDAAGYHLPFVDFAVSSGAAAGVPARLRYVGTYPHDAELLFAIGRLGLSDDTWLDAAQLPFGAIGAGATALLAARWGARPAGALAAGALWLAVPAVFLQLPSGYVDVCVAAFLLLAIYWILAPPTPPSVILSGVALGLFLGSKPSAPLPALALGLLLAVRARRAGHARWLPLALAAAAVVGAPDYLANLRRFGNPVWPVALDLGPLHLPGTTGVSGLLASGAAAQRVTGPLWSRLWHSWTALRSTPVFDMRVGGLGSVVVLLALPAAAATLYRRPASAWLALGAALLVPEPSTARFILAFPALCLALAAVPLAALPPRAAALALAGAAALAALDLRYAAPGLTGGGPALAAYAAMSDEQRLRALGPDGPPGPWIDLRRRLDPGQAIAFDSSFDLSHLLWRRRLDNRVVFVPDEATPAEVAALLARENVRFLVAGAGSAAGAAVAATPASFRRLFPCRAEACAVYERLSARTP